MSEFLTTKELAALLRVRERKVYDLVSTGGLPVRRVTGKLLFPRRDIEEWIAASAAPGAGVREALPLPVSAAITPPLPLVMARRSQASMAGPDRSS